MMLMHLVLSSILAFQVRIDAIRHSWRGKGNGRFRRKEKRTILSLEGLEERWVPATTDLWIGPINGSWNVATNWGSGKVPQAGDTLQFGGSFGGKTGANTASTDNMPTADNYAGLTINSDFS
jgi:hypothetical protein